MTETTPNKFCIILRGLPGTGKDILANLLSNIAAPGMAKVLSTDDFFTSNDKFNFDKTKLKDAHKATWESFKREVEVNQPLIIINNTNFKRFHYAHYVDYAQRHDYFVAIMTIPFNDVTNRELALRNVHGVDQDTIRRMRHSFEWEL